MTSVAAQPATLVDTPTHLSLIVDLSPQQWELSAVTQNELPLSFESFLSQLLIFINSHLAGKHENTITVLGALPGRSVMLYSSEEASVSSVSLDASVYQPFKLVNNAVAEKIKAEFSSSHPDQPIGLVGAVTKALCHLNKILHTSGLSEGTSATSSTPKDARILILSVSPDISSSYIPIMNSIFAAQKLKVKIDVCKLYGDDNVFLQQAAHLTGGSYVSLGRRDAPLQYLLMAFLASNYVSQNLLTLPTQDRVDLRAACFCHKNIVDIGYVCSVCLSIFCSPIPVCSTCRTKFPMKTLRRYGYGAKPATSGQSSQGGGTPKSQTPTQA